MTNCNRLMRTVPGSAQDTDNIFYVGYHDPSPDVRTYRWSGPFDANMPREIENAAGWLRTTAYIDPFEEVLEETGETPRPLRNILAQAVAAGAATFRYAGRVATVVCG